MLLRCAIVQVDDPNDFQIISTIAIPGEASDTIVRYSLYQDSYIYFGDFSGFLQVWSIEDLETPTLLSDSIFVGILTETAIDNVNGRLYMTRDAQDGNPNAFIMYDISQDPANPQVRELENILSNKTQSIHAEPSPLSSLPSSRSPTRI